VVDFWNIH